MIDDKALEAAFEAEVAEIEPGSELWRKVQQRIASRWWSSAGVRRGAGVAAAVCVLTAVGVAAAQGGLLWSVFPGLKAPLPKGESLSGAGTQLRVAEAEKQAGFHILLPTVLPAGINADDVAATVSQIPGRSSPLVTVGYWRVKEHPGGASSSRALTVEQLAVGDQPWFRPENLRTPDGQSMRVTCDQQSVVLRSTLQAIWSTCDYGRPYLTWVDGGYEFKLSDASVKLSREQLLEIARSMK